MKRRHQLKQIGYINITSKVASHGTVIVFSHLLLIEKIAEGRMEEQVKI
jgi:hypothetical protein